MEIKTGFLLPYLISLVSLSIGQPNPIDTSLESYIRDGLREFRSWMIEQGHTDTEFDLSGPHIQNISDSLYTLSSDLRDAKFQISWQNLIVNRVTSLVNQGLIMVEFRPEAQPAIIGTHMTEGSVMGQPVNANGDFNRTYIEFFVQASIYYQLNGEGYLVCDQRGPTYSSSIFSLTNFENFLAPDHVLYSNIMDVYGERISTLYSQDLLRLQGLLATKEFLCKILLEKRFEDIVSPTTTTTTTATPTTTTTTATQTTATVPTTVSNTTTTVETTTPIIQTTITTHPTTTEATTLSTSTTTATANEIVLSKFSCIMFSLLYTLTN